MLAHFKTITEKTQSVDFTQAIADKLFQSKLHGTLQDYIDYCKTNNTNKILQLLLQPVIDQYYKHFNVPIRVNFLNQTTNISSNDMSVFEQEYWSKTSDFYIQHKLCTTCGNLTENEECTTCWFKEKQFDTSYTDSARTNFNTRYCYVRKQHFFECLIQFQGKQPVVIETHIIELLKKQITTAPTKRHIMKLLKENNAVRHYENIHLIYSLVTGIPCHNIDHLEKILLEDFDLYLIEYNKLVSDRKNFINVQYVLFQLLLRHRVSVTANDFILPRTADIKRRYDTITQKIFEIQKWNFNV